MYISPGTPPGTGCMPSLRIRTIMLRIGLPMEGSADPVGCTSPEVATTVASVGPIQLDQLFGNRSRGKCNRDVIVLQPITKRCRAISRALVDQEHACAGSQ